jgi:hypothetical protein
LKKNPQILKFKFRPILLIFIIFDKIGWTGFEIHTKGPCVQLLAAAGCLAHALFVAAKQLLDCKLWSLIGHWQKKRNSTAAAAAFRWPIVPFWQV